MFVNPGNFWWYCRVGSCKLTWPISYRRCSLNVPLILTLSTIYFSIWSLIGLISLLVLAIFLISSLTHRRPWSWLHMWSLVDACPACIPMMKTAKNKRRIFRNALFIIAIEFYEASSKTIDIHRIKKMELNDVFIAMNFIHICDFSN